MACARRSLASNFTLLTRRFHPSLSHLLPHHRDPDTTQNPPPPAAVHRSFNWERTRHGPGSAFSLPVGLEPSLRRYSSSSSGGSSGGEYIKEDIVTDAFVEKGADVADVLLSEKSLEIASQVASPAVGEVAAAAADSAFPVAALQHVIDAVHSFTGLDWWAAIAVTTFLIRSATIPLMIHQLKITTKLSLLRPELDEMKEQMQNSMDPHVMQENQRRMKELFKKHGVTPFAPLKGMFIQGPVFISFYLAISNMVEKVPSFKEGGAFWFTDLTMPDPLYVLPVLTSLTFLVNVELNTQDGMEGNPAAVNMKKFFRVVAVLTVPFTASFPKAIFCYWITSNLFSLAYGLVIKRPPVRRFLNLPEAVPQPPASSMSFPFFGGPKQVAPTASTSLLSAAPSESPDRRTSSSPAISQRIRNLERTVKGRKKHRK